MAKVEFTPKSHLYCYFYIVLVGFLKKPPFLIINGTRRIKKPSVSEDGQHESSLKNPSKKHPSLLSQSRLIEQKNPTFAGLCHLIESWEQCWCKQVQRKGNRKWCSVYIWSFKDFWFESVTNEKNVLLQPPRPGIGGFALPWLLPLKTTPGAPVLCLIGVACFPPAPPGDLSPEPDWCGRLHTCWSTVDQRKGPTKARHCSFLKLPFSQGQVRVPSLSLLLAQSKDF